METKEKSFEELINEAARISDKRSEIFNTLIGKITNVYIPALGKTLEGYDLGKTFFRLNNKPRKGFDLTHDINGNKYYGLCISYDGEIHEAVNEYCYESERFEWHLCNSDWYNKDEYNLLKGSAIELAEAIKARIVELNKTYARKNERAEKIISES